MAELTQRQKEATRMFMLESIRQLKEEDSNVFVMRAVTHLPWVNQNHAQGILSDLAKKDKLVCRKGKVRRKENV